MFYVILLTNFNILFVIHKKQTNFIFIFVFTNFFEYIICIFVFYSELMTIKISIIIPCYNASLFISNTINAVKNQSFKDWECIIINDGSTDNSLEIIEKEIHNDERFELITQQNLGLSKSRNTGMKAAKGDYVFFLDADDFIPNMAIEDLYSFVETTSSIDIIIGQTLITKGQENNPVKFLQNAWPKNVFLTNKDESFIKFMIKNSTTCVAQNRLYSKRFLTTNSLFFYDEIFHEDELWYFETMIVAKNIICIDATTYFYNMSNEFAITKNISKKNIMDYVTILNYIFSKYYLNYPSSCLKDCIGVYILNLKIRVLELFSTCKEEDKEDAFEYVNENFKFLKVSRNVFTFKNKLEKKLMLYNFITYFNAKKACFILNFYNNRNFLIKFCFKVFILLNYYNYKKVQSQYYQLEC
jgi:glycosyltransferase involved in cell wall biosynthesis